MKAEQAASPRSVLGSAHSDEAMERGHSALPWEWAKLSQHDTPPRVMAKVAIWLHWLAAVLALALLAVPPTSALLVSRIVPLALAAAAFTVVIHRVPWERLPPRLFVLVSLIDIGMIWLGTAMSGGVTSRYQLLYILVIVFAAYFFSIPAAASVIVVAVAALLAPLEVQTAPNWLLPLDIGMVGSFVLVAAVVKETVLRVERERVLRDDAEAHIQTLYGSEVEKRTTLQQKSRQLETILEMGNAFRLQLGLDALLERIVSAIAERIGFRAVLVRLFDPITGEAMCRAVHGVDWDIVQPPTPPELIRSLMDPRFQISRSYLVEVSASDLDDPDKRTFLYVRPDDAAESGEWKPENSLIVPLESSEHGLIGIISIDEPVDGKIPALETIQALEIFANLAATAIDNARLLEEAGEARALRELDRLKSEFLASVSHDLRTPLTVIKGSIDLLGMQMDDLSATQQKLISAIDRNTARLVAMVEQLLEMIQLQDGRIQLQLQLTDINGLVEETVETMRLAGEPRGQQLILQSAPDEALLLVDRNRIQQVVTNLIGNAVKYGPEGQPIEIQVDNGPSDITVSVHDYGGNIPPEEQERIFERFYRSAAESMKAEGAGLGLAICKSLIDLHHGRVWVSSRAGKGTTFQFTLPKDRGRA